MDGPATLRALTDAHYAWVLVSLAAVFAVALIKTARWGVLFKISERPASFAELFTALMVTQMLNALIPIRIGEVVRIALMKQSGQSGATTLSTIATEKVMDLIAAGMLAVAVVTWTVAPDWLQNWAATTLVLGLAAIGGLALVWHLRNRIEEIAKTMLMRWGYLPESWTSQLLRVLRTFLTAFGVLTTLNIAVRVVLWTGLSWLASLFSLGAMFAAFGLQLPWAAVVVLVLSMSFSNLVPSPPALVGIMQALVVAILGAYGVSQPTALGLGLVLNVTAVAPLILLGSLGLSQRSISIAGLVWQRGKLGENKP
jgi:uncharacterized protein (TIRG00374 family)